MLAFIHIEKAAGTLISSSLRMMFGVHHVDVEPWDRRNDFFSYRDLQRLRKFSPGIRSIAGHKVKPYSDLEKQREGVKYFTFIRDPIVRCASHYQYQVNIMGKEISFQDWIQKENLQNFQVRKLAGCGDLNKAMDMIHSKLFFVGIVEDFSKSINRFFNLTGIDFNVYEQRMVRKNIAQDNRIKEQLLTNSETREILKSTNQLDIKLYQYVKEITNYDMDSTSRDMSMKSMTSNRSPSAVKFYQNLLFRNIIYKPLLTLYRVIN
jgi:hypothetical protein